jgi:hypothetical protein
MLEAKIRFFDIKRCGFYMRGDSTAKFGGLSNMLEQLSAWATDGRAFANTTCYQADADNDLYNTYFCSWSQNKTTKDSLLVLWNQTPNDDGVIYAMNPTLPPGGTSMLTTDFGGKPAIPGAPSYIWFVPSKNVFATIRFSHSVQGKGNLDHYLNGFLLNKTPYRVKDKDEKVIGYSKTGVATKDSARISPKFEAHGRKQEELETELLANIANIRKIVKRETLLYSVPDDRKVVERVFSKLLGTVPVLNKPRTISHELQFTPSVTELKSIIKNFGELGQDTFIKNAGFVYKDGKKVMLTGCSVAFPHQININRGDDQLLSSVDLLAQITLQRESLLQALDASAFQVEEAED